MDLDAARRRHLSAVAAAARSPGTLKSYGMVERAYIGYLEDRGAGEAPPLAELNLERVRAYLTWLRHVDTSVRWGGTTVGHSDANVAYHAQVLKTWGNFLADECEDLLPAGNPLRKLRVPIVRPRPPTVLTIEQLQSLVALCAGTGNPQRDEALVLFAIETGCRVSEICGLRLEDVEPAAADGPGVAKVLGKGRKWRTVGFGLRCSEALGHYVVDERARRDRHGSPLAFLAQDGRPLTPRMVRDLLGRLKRRGGIRARVHPHGLRHAFATLQAQAGANAHLLQALLGHSSAAMTAHYVHMAQNDPKRLYRSLADGWGRGSGGDAVPPRDVF
jgi:site-specific recombinase XerD